MNKHSSCLQWLGAFLGLFFPAVASAQIAPNAGEQAVAITAITPSVNTGQNYSPWLDDNLKNLVQSNWSGPNMQYIDVTLRLQKAVVLSRISFYDHVGVFVDRPASIYAQNGTVRTLLGLFTGQQFNQYVSLAVPGSVKADAIVIRKYGNNIPVKVKVFEQTSTAPVPVPAVLTFAPLPARTAGSAAVALSASSSNAVTPITFASSNPAVVSVAQVAGQWQATMVSPGSATVTAAQAATPAYLTASVSQTQQVQPAPGPVGTGGVAGRIPVDAARWYGLSNAPNDIQGIFDGSTATGSVTRYGKIVNSYDSYYTLQPGETMTLESVRQFDPGGGVSLNEPMVLSVITNTWQRLPVASFTGGRGGQWVGPDPANPTNFSLATPFTNIRALVITASWLYPRELELYGTYSAGTPLPAADPVVLAEQRRATLSQHMGINAFEWEILDHVNPGLVNEGMMASVKNFSAIRHYMDWEKLEETEGNYTFSPTHRGGWDYDAMYQRCAAEGIEVLACLKTVPGWLQDTWPAAERDNENVPVRYGRDFNDPVSYLEQAKVAFQYIARYGYNPNVNPALVRVNTAIRWYGDHPNQVRIGLGLIRYIECDNERDKWWKGRKGYQTGREYAANLSAFYDGHKNTMGPGVGVKNADPGVKVAMAGVASPNADYVRGMVDWCREFRGLRPDGSVNLCWDIINFHLYSNDAGSTQSGASTRGVAPEVAEGGLVAQSFVRIAHQYSQDMPVWVTEAGFDVNQGSIYHAIPVGNKTVLETQADWILRTSLLYARWGIARTFFYQLTDANINDPMQFSSSGLLHPNLSPKPATDYLRQTNELLGTFRYQTTLNRDPLVDRYTTSTRTAYALTIPDEQGRTGSYTLALPGVDSASICHPQIGQAHLRIVKVRVLNGQLTLPVTETPTFVVVGSVSTPAGPAPCAGTGTISWQQWTNVTGSGVALIPTQTPATTTAVLTQFESGRNVADNYGARIRGYVCPPQSGSYVFRLSGDDDCELWLSADDNPANKVRIAHINGFTNYREWNKYASQQSAPVALVAGRRYYVETLQKEIGGEDHLSVAWTLPTGQFQAPIAGAHLLPYVPSATGNRAAPLATGPAQPGAQPALTVYPNPFGEQTTVEFSLPVAGPATLAVYDIRNRLVQQVFSGSAEAGAPRRFALAGAGLAPGVYLVQLTTATQVVTRKLVRMN